MTTIKAFVNSHPVLCFFALAFAISWGGILSAVGLGPGGFSATPQQFQMAVPYAVPAMVLGPAVAGILLIGLIDGRAGLREFISRLLKWRVGARWYAVALFTAPILITGVMLSLSLISPEFLPRIFIATDKASVLLLGIAVGLTAGIFEELGWTGFAVPRMRQRYSVLAIPVRTIQHDVVERLLAGEYRREQDPVVVRMRLRAEDGHVIRIGCDCE